MKHQTAEDHEALCREHGQFTDRVGDEVIALQDKAFELGRQRGLAEGKAIRDELLGTLRHIEGAAMDLSCARRAISACARAAIAKATGGQA